MERSLKRLKKFAILVGIPILSTTIIISLIYYCSVWYASHKVLVINTTNVSSFAILVLAIFLSTAINIGLTIYYSQSLKKIEKLVTENCNLSELLLQVQMKSNNDLMSVIKDGEKNE